MSLPLAAFLLGFISGLRSMTAPFAVSLALRRGWILSRVPLVSALGSTFLFSLAALAAVGELIADKLPFTPSRLKPASLGVRAILGAGSGAVVMSVASPGITSIAMGGLLGASGAIAGARAGYHARRTLVRSLKTPDWPIALLEDFVAVGGALYIVSHS